MGEKKRIYDRDVLLDLLKRKYTCVFLKQCNRILRLHPKYIKEVKTGIKEALNKGLNKYDFSLKGVLLDYQNLKVLGDRNCGRIVGKHGEFLVTVHADFFIFQPEIGNLLQGVVNVKTDNHVGCLVHKRFNAMILKPEEIESQDWCCKDIHIGDTIVFEIVDHVSSGPVPYIQGRIFTEFLEKIPNKAAKFSSDISLVSECIENGHCEVDNKPREDIEKNVLSHSNEENILCVTSKNKSKDDGEIPKISGKKKKSKHKDKKVDSSNNVSDEKVLNSSENSSFSSVKVKKVKKQKSENDDLQQIKKKATYFPLSSTLLAPEQDFRPELEEISSPVAHLDVDPVSYQSKKNKKKMVKDIHASEVTEDSQRGDEQIKHNALTKKKKNGRVEEGELLKNFTNALNKTAKMCSKIDMVLDDNIVVGSSAELIESLMKEKPTHYMPYGQPSPQKNTSPLSTKEFSMDKVQKTPEKIKSNSTKKRKRDETSIANEDNDGCSPKKKKTKSGLEKSLFSDSECSLNSPKKASKGSILQDNNDFPVDNNTKTVVDSIIDKNWENENVEGEEKQISSTVSSNVNEVSKNSKKTKDNNENKKKIKKEKTKNSLVKNMKKDGEIPTSPVLLEKRSGEHQLRTVSISNEEKQEKNSQIENFPCMPAMESKTGVSPKKKESLKAKKRQVERELMNTEELVSEEEYFKVSNSKPLGVNNTPPDKPNTNIIQTESTEINGKPEGGKKHKPKSDTEHKRKKNKVKDEDEKERLLMISKLMKKVQKDLFQNVDEENWML